MSAATHRTAGTAAATTAQQQNGNGIFQSVTGAVSETYSANQTTNITGTLDLDASTEVDIDSALINLN